MATLTGRVTKDARQVTKDGNTFIAFDLVENDSYTNAKGEKIKNSYYFNCTYRNIEKLLPHLVTGKLLSIEGNITARPYTSKNGETKASTNVSVKSIKFLGGGESGKKNKAPKEPAAAGSPVDDLPF